MQTGPRIREDEKMPKRVGQYRQGDVLVEKIAALPKGCKEVKAGRCVLALGEVTGHAHEVLDAIMYEGSDGKFYLRVDAPTDLVHTSARFGLELSGDHGTVALEPGIYEVTRQAEKLGDVWRTVSD